MVTPASFSACSVNSISDSPCWARLISGSPLKLNASRQEPVTVVGSADAAPTSLTECSIGVCKCTAHPLLDLWLMFIRLKDSLGKPAVACGGPWAGPDGVTCVVPSDNLFPGGTGQWISSAVSQRDFRFCSRCLRHRNLLQTILRHLSLRIGTRSWTLNN